MKKIDLRSDTVTLPTDSMFSAINQASLGDDVYEEDLSTIELEKLAASITGKDCGLLVSSGTMGNLISNMVHCPRGTESIMGDKSHTFLYESGGISSYGGIHSHQLKNNQDGTIDTNLIEDAIRTDDVHFPITSLICLENTHNKCYGYPLSLDYINEVCDLGHNNNICIHMDGARIFNACTALNTTADIILKNVDSITFCLSKGLSAPIGSILCGDRNFINKARKIRKSLGGGMRQSGIIAAAGIIGLKNMQTRLKDDHINAYHLASGIASINGIEVSLNHVKTNIIYFSFSHRTISTAQLLESMQSKKIYINNYQDQHFRLVLHAGISKDDIEKVIYEFNKLLS